MRNSAIKAYITNAVNDVESPKELRAQALLESLVFIEVGLDAITRLAQAIEDHNKVWLPQEQK